MAGQSKPHTPPKQFIQQLQDPQLKAIAGTETSFGVNLAHPEVERGMHKGMSAGGPFGMMPIVAAETYYRDPELREKHMWFEDYAKDPSQAHGEITQILNDSPELAYDLARSHFNYLKGRTPDTAQQFYKWYRGQNIQPTKKDLRESDYVQQTLRNLDEQRGIRSDYLDREQLKKLFKP